MSLISEWFNLTEGHSTESGWYSIQQHKIAVTLCLRGDGFQDAADGQLGLCTVVAKEGPTGGAQLVDPNTMVSDMLLPSVNYGSFFAGKNVSCLQESIQRNGGRACGTGGIIDT